MAQRLDELPPEILGQIVSNIETVRVLLRLSLTSRRLHHYVRINGYRVFVQNNFSFADFPPLWSEAAHAFTTLSRSWQRRSLLASYILPELDITYLPHKPRNTSIQRHLAHQPRRQTMGFQAQIDCIGDWTGGNWNAREETIAVGAGAELILRTRNMGDEVEKSYCSASKEDRDLNYDLLHHRRQEIVWKEDAYREGRDDIISLNLLHRHHLFTDHHNTRLPYHLIVGRASGILERVSLSRDAVETMRYDTGSHPVRCTHVSPPGSSLLAACLADCDVALYALNSPAEDLTSLSRVTLATKEDNSRIWTSRFLSPTRLAIGRGPTTAPLSVFDITPTGLLPDALQTFKSATASSIYAIAPFPSPVGQMFLSGWHSGEVLLHDQRCPEVSSAAASFTDPLDPTSPIYSLLLRGSDRFIAGGGRHALIKAFDIRMPGIRRYSTSHGTVTGGCNPDDSFNLFIRHREHPPNPVSPNYLSPLLPADPPQQLSSPVYSLASASLFSPTFYAGLERNVVQFWHVDPLDKWPDGEYKKILERHGKLEDWWGSGRCSGETTIQVRKEAWATAGVVLGLAEYGGRESTRAGGSDGVSGMVKLYTLDEAGNAVAKALSSQEHGNSKSNRGSDGSYVESSSTPSWLDPRWKVESKPRQHLGLLRREESRGRGTGWARYGARRGNGFV